MPFLTTVANQILTKILKNTDFTHPTALYMALFTADPGETGASNEVSGGSYARQSIAFGTAATKTISNSGAINFTGMPAATVTHWGLFSASSGGTFWWGGALTASKTTGAGDTLNFAIGEVDITLT